MENSVISDINIISDVLNEGFHDFNNLKGLVILISLDNKLGKQQWITKVDDKSG